MEYLKILQWHDAPGWLWVTDDVHSIWQWDLHRQRLHDSQEQVRMLSTGWHSEQGRVPAPWTWAKKFQEQVLLKPLWGAKNALCENSNPITCKLCEATQVSEPFLALKTSPTQEKSISLHLMELLQECNDVRCFELCQAQSKHNFWVVVAMTIHSYFLSYYYNNLLKSG